MNSTPEPNTLESASELVKKLPKNSQERMDKMLEFVRKFELNDGKRLVLFAQLCGYPISFGIKIGENCND